MEVEFIGASDAQVKWGEGDDPRPLLEVGQIYTVDDTQEHTWHKLYFLEGFAGGFNSACFKESPNE